MSVTIKTTIRIALLILQLFIILPTFPQIYQPDGLRMPGTWNNWVNDPNMGGPFDLQKQNEGTPRWTTTFQYTGNQGFDAFKFVSTSFGNPWGNQWAGNVSMTVNSLQTLTYGTPSDPDNNISLVQNHWYTVVFEDLGYANSSVIFMETTSEPVNISNVMQNPVVVSSTDIVEISATLSAVPSPEEHFYLRYSSDEWLTSTVVYMNKSGNSLLAGIPPQVSQTEVTYYIFSSVMVNPVSGFDLITLKMANNNGQNYSYIVDQVFECNAQLSLVSSEPPFPQHNLPVTVYFNAAFGNGGLFDYEGDIYAHTGVITNLSQNSTDWKYVKTEWGENTPETKMTRIDDNLYSITLDNIREYYGVPASEEIHYMAFVFRSDVEQPGGYYLEQKNADGSDILLYVYPLSINVKIINPTRREPLASPNSVLMVCAEALENQQISLYLDDDLLLTQPGSSLAYPLVLQGMEPGAYWLKAVATGSGRFVRDSVQIYLRGPVAVEALPEGMKNGVNYIDNNTVTLVLHDPPAQKQFAFAIGEYSDWLPNDDNYMKRTPDGKHHWLTLEGIQSGKEYAYQYFIDGNLKIADAYAEKILDPWNDRWIPSTTYPGLKQYPFDKTTGVVSVFQTNKTPYVWQYPDFTPPAVHATQSDLFIYELLVRDFVDTRSLAEVQTKLDYLKTLGINAIELMPVMEFDGNESWGYAPNFFFATDKFYGTEISYKTFIDECHKRDMAVILDIVTNHAYGLNPMVQMYFDPDTGSGQTTPSNPWFNQQATHPYSIGYDFNHESTYTRQFIKDVFAYWLNEFKVDGFRLDLSKGLTQTNSGEDIGAWSAYDQSRVNILTDYYNHIKSVNPDAYVILEHLGVNDEEVVLANTGMLMWSAMHQRYKQVGMGWQENSDISWAYHANRGYNYPNLIDYMENHDEERLMFENLSYGNATASYNIKDTLTSVSHLRQAAVLFLGIPGPKMIWQFGELGYDYSIFFGGDRLANKPPRWDYFNQPERQELYRTYSAMAGLRKSDAFRMGSFSGDLSVYGKRIWISHASMNVVISANMGVNAFDMAPGFPNAGTWYNYFTGEAVNITDPSGHTFNFGPGDFKVFTSVQLPRPYYYVNVTVTDSVTGAVIDSAMVSLQGSGYQYSSPAGTAGFTAAPTAATLQVTKAGYKPNNQSVAVNADLNITIKMQMQSNIGVDEVDPAKAVKVWPNPAADFVNISTSRLYFVSVYSADGRLLQQLQMRSLTETLDISALKPGIYLLKFDDGKQSFGAKFVKHE
jgi:hypothetical protein